VSFARDLRQAVRALRKSPGFAAAAIATLAIGIGANTALFSVVRSVLWRPLPYLQADRLVRIGHLQKTDTRPGRSFSPEDFDDLRRAAPGISAAACWEYVPGLSGTNVTGAGEPAHLETAFVSGSFFPLLGTRPLLGRTLVDSDDVVGKDASVVISDRVWRDRLGADPRVTERSVNVDGKPVRIVGVMPSEFAYPSAAVDLWAPVSRMTEDDVPHRRDVRWLSVLASLAPDETPASVQAKATELFAALERQYPDSNRGFGRAIVQPLAETLLGDVRTPLLLLLGAVGLVLLVLCGNLAGLLLARGAARGREVAIRAALGASRGRLVSTLLAESTVLAAAGGVGGLAVGLWTTSLLPRIADAIPRAAEIRLDTGALVFTFALSAVAGLLFGLLPALPAARASLVTALESGGRGSGPDRRRSGLLRGLVVAECVLAGVLLAGAGLLAKSFWRLATVDSGARPERVLAISLSIPSEIVNDDSKLAAYRALLLGRLAALPGVRAVGASKSMPFSGGGEAYNFFVDRRSGPAERYKADSGTIIVTGGYFQALGIPILAGRAITAEDLERNRLVIVVNESAARKVWPGENPLGKTLRLGQKSFFEVIGVARDVRHEGLSTAPRDAVYVPANQFPRGSLKIFLRTAIDPAALAAAARQTIWSVHADQPISEIATLPDVLSRSVARPRFYMLLLVGFSVTALGLAALGVYGTLSYAMRQRRREIGIRIALGAQAADVRSAVVGEAGRLALLGLAIALPLSLVASRLLRSLLFEVRPADPLVLAGSALFLMVIAIAAGYFPARAASRVDPAQALRQE
jgi:putative ABC transport system permease protein